MTMRRSRLLAQVAMIGLWVAPCAGLGGCGGQDPEADGPVQFTNWKPVFEAAMDALGRRDYGDFVALMTPGGRATLERDLGLYARMLADPIEGPRQLKHVRARWPDVPEDLIARARGGDVEAAWTLFLGAATPAGVTPRQAGMLLDPKQKDTLSLRYRYSEHDNLGLDMRRVGGRWLVDAIELRKTS